MSEEQRKALLERATYNRDRMLTMSTTVYYVYGAYSPQYDFISAMVDYWRAAVEVIEERRTYAFKYYTPAGWRPS